MADLLTPATTAFLVGVVSIFTTQALIELGVRYARRAVTDS